MVFVILLICCNDVALFFAPWMRCLMPSSVIRRLTERVALPVITAISKPADCAILMARPSLTWNRFASTP